MIVTAYTENPSKKPTKMKMFVFLIHMRFDLAINRVSSNF